MKCEKCGCEAPERAVICPECGEILPRKKTASSKSSGMGTSAPDSFSMPFLHAPETAESGTDTEAVQDPTEIKRQQRQRRTLLRRRIVGLSAAAVVLILVILYSIFFAEYKSAVFRYVKGADYSSGSMYASLVPDSYLDYLNTTYSFTRREVKEKVGEYFVSWNKNYSTSGSISYRINSADALSQEQLQEIEAELKSLYGISEEIKKGYSVRLTIDDGGNMATETASFVKIGFRYYCVEAMEDIDDICLYDGYDQW